MTARTVKICVADPNPRVRGLLRREFVACGYEVVLARSTGEVIELCRSDNPPDLLVVDPEMSRADSEPLLSRLSAWMPALPVVLHAYAGDSLNHPAAAKAAAVVEKSGDTLRLRAVVGKLVEHNCGKAHDA